MFYLSRWLNQFLAGLLSLALVATSSPIAQAFAAPNPDSFGQFALPSNLGYISDVYHGPSDRTVVLIQDLHLHYPTQQRIIKILDRLYSQGFVSGSLAIEGYEGAYDTSYTANFPAGKTKNWLVDYFLKKGELSAPEAFSILQGNGHLLYGVDKAQYYDLNRNLFKASWQDRRNLDAQLTRIQSGFNRLKRQHYSYALRRLDKEEAYDTASAEQLLQQKLALCPDAATRNLVTADYILRLTRQLIRQEVTLDETRYIAQRLPEFVRLTNELLAADTTDSSISINVAETLKSAIDFYLVALMRNQPIAENTLKLLTPVSAAQPADTSHPQAIALVAGGFHTASLTKAFKEAGVSYVVITPALTQTPDAAYHELYEKRLAGEHLSRTEMAKDFGLSNEDRYQDEATQEAVLGDDESVAVVNPELTSGEDGSFELGWRSRENLPRMSPVAVGDESAQEAAVRLSGKALLASADRRFHSGNVAPENEFQLAISKEGPEQIKLQALTRRKPSDDVNKLIQFFSIQMAGQTGTPARQLFEQHILPVIRQRLLQHHERLGEFPRVVISDHRRLITAKIPMVELFQNGHQILIVNSAWLDEMIQAAGVSLGHITTGDELRRMDRQIGNLNEQIREHNSYLNNDYYYEFEAASREDSQNQHRTYRAAMQSWGPLANVRVARFTHEQDEVDEKKESAEKAVASAEEQIRRLRRSRFSWEDAEAVNLRTGERLAHALSHDFSAPEDEADWRDDENAVMIKEAQRYRATMFANGLDRSRGLSAYGSLMSLFSQRHKITSEHSGWLFSPEVGQYARLWDRARQGAKTVRDRILKFNNLLHNLVRRLKSPSGIRTSPIVPTPETARELEGPVALTVRIGATNTVGELIDIQGSTNNDKYRFTIQWGGFAKAVGREKDQIADGYYWLFFNYVAKRLLKLLDTANVSELRVVKLGLSFAGPVEGNKVTSTNMAVHFNREELLVDLQKALAERKPGLSSISIQTLNDADAGALGEYMDLRGKLHGGDGIYIIWGTGIGGSALRNGKIDPTIKELGHALLMAPNGEYIYKSIADLTEAKLYLNGKFSEPSTIPSYVGYSYVEHRLAGPWAAVRFLTEVVAGDPQWLSEISQKSNGANVTPEDLGALANFPQQYSISQWGEKANEATVKAVMSYLLNSQKDLSAHGLAARAFEVLLYKEWESALGTLRASIPNMPIVLGSSLAELRRGDAVFQAHLKAAGPDIEISDLDASRENSAFAIGLLSSSIDSLGTTEQQKSHHKNIFWAGVFAPFGFEYWQMRFQPGRFVRGHASLMQGRLSWMLSLFGGMGATYGLISGLIVLPHAAAIGVAIVVGFLVTSTFVHLLLNLLFMGATALVGLTEIVSPWLREHAQVRRAELQRAQNLWKELNTGDLTFDAVKANIAQLRAEISDQSTVLKAIWSLGVPKTKDNLSEKDFAKAVDQMVQSAA